MCLTNAIQKLILCICIGGNILRAALIYFGENKKLDLFIKMLVNLFEKSENELKVFKVERSSNADNFSSFDFILAGCPVINSFKGKVPKELDMYLQRSSGMERKKAAVFIIPKFIGNEKTLKNLMSVLEKKGSFVIDFLQIKSPEKDSTLLFSHLK